MAEVINYRIETILYNLKNQDKIQYIKEMIENLKKDEEKNKELIAIMNDKLLTLEVENENIKDEEILETAKKTHPDLNKLKLVKTSKFDNDSKKDITYLNYINEYGETEMIELQDEETLKNFIKNHNSKDITAKEVFEYYKNHISREVQFDDKDANQKNKAVLDDEIIKDIEYKKVEEYKKENGLFDDIEISIDSNGERLYKVGNTIIKFETVSDERKLKVLETGKEMNQISEEVLENANLNEKTESEKVEETENISSLSESEQLDYLTNNVDYDISYRDFEEIIQKVLINEEQCDLDTHAKIIVFVKKLKEVIDKKIANDENCEYENKYLDYYMENIDAYYQAYKDGYETKYQLSEQEILMIEEYKKELELSRQPKTRERVDNTKE